MAKTPTRPKERHRERIRRATNSTEFGRPEWHPTARAHGAAAMSSARPMGSSSYTDTLDYQPASVGVCKRDASTRFKIILGGRI